MKNKLFLLAFFCMCAIGMNAQSDSQYYLAQAWECLNSENCDGAQRNYDVYKQMTGKRNSSLEGAIQNCMRTKSSSTKRYKIGDDMPITLNYTIAKSSTGVEKMHSSKFIGRIVYLDNSGEHGKACYNYGSGNLTEAFDGMLLGLRLIPTYEEFRKLIPNLIKLGFEEGDEFWTRTSNDSQTYKCIRLGIDGRSSAIYKDKDTGYSGILIIANF